ncbi:hypothetical protein FM076_03905 [Streptomyces albus subsp. chlorinus]|uniref:hypothetical protein n=1 Tax=Streptomyces albus TaxID=1888 RepID=UPI00156E936C|nr:hypothetical protein [Streptomyces albus]NSC20406.1 hypothetical protein [Streptomyces albus subsp. chlorinus]
MRIRTAIAASVLGAATLLGATAGTATAVGSDPHPHVYNDPDVLDLGANVCGIPIIPVLSQNASKCKVV